MSHNLPRFDQITLSKSFSTRLSFYILLIVAVLFLTANGIVAVSTHKLTEETATKNATNQLRSTVHSIEAVMNSIEATVRTLSFEVGENIDDGEVLYRITRECLRSNQDICGCAIAFEAGRYRGKSDFSPYSFYGEDGAIESKDLHTEDYDYKLMDWYQIPKLLGREYWTDPYYDEGGAEVMMTTFSCPLYDENGEFFAVITADMNLRWLSDYILSIKPYENTVTWLVASNGAFVANPNPEHIMNYTIFTNPIIEGNEEQIDLIKEVMSEGQGTMTLEMPFGRTFMVYAPLKNGWPIAILCPFKDVFKKAIQMNFLLLMVTSLGLFALFVLCLITIRRLTRPLSDFSDSAISIARGDFTAPLPQIKTRDEMWKLRESFSIMQNSLVQRIEELKNATAARERIASELNIAREIQLAMVPDGSCESDRIRLKALMNPAKAVGGDLYDYFEKDGHFYFCVGDVSGKGVPASMVMAITRSAFRYVAGLIPEPENIMKEINDSLSDNNETNLFVTLFIGNLDLETGIMKYCNAGHTPIYVVTAGGEVTGPDEEKNIVVGVFSGYEFKGQEIRLSPGSALFAYTDGITEAENADKELFGDAALKQALSDAGSVEPAELVDSVIGRVASFTAGAEQNDDITVLSFLYRDGSAG